jgi:hypothetical protein
MAQITTIEEARKLTYGFHWNRKKYEEGRCCKSVYPNERGASSHQCTRKNGHGPAGLYCKLHSPDTIAKKQEAERAKWAERLKERKLERAAPELLAALQGLLRYAEINTCQHDETQRGGAIWTICNQCGRKWADDEGGFQPYVEPKEITNAYAAITRAQP